MEARAFVEPDIDALLDTALAAIPPDSLIARQITDLRGWHTDEPDWQSARTLLEQRYGYHLYGGGCHTVPNFGVIILALLWGAGDWDISMMIVNTAVGTPTATPEISAACWVFATDSTPSPEGWRGPVADRLYLPTADGGRAVTDIATEAVRLAGIGRALHGGTPMVLKDGARFHFSLPGSVQGFAISAGDGTVVHVTSTTLAGDTSQALRITTAGSRSVTATTATFIPPEARDKAHYELLASPALSPGQRVRAAVAAPSTNDDRSMPAWLSPATDR